MSHVLLTGLPGVGKTTLIRELGKRLADYHPAGFYTEEIREEGIRKGFRLESLDGRQLTLAHSDRKGPHRVGRYARRRASPAPRARADHQYERRQEAAIELV